MTVWLISDHHFGHANILRFMHHDGVRGIRTGYRDVDDMREKLIAAWNDVVKPSDHVYHLGDFALTISSTVAGEIARCLNGHKRLVRGNHDRYQTPQYVKMGFKEIHGLRYLGDLWLTHAPIHPWSMGKAKGNVHGHIHEKDSPPGAYLNVCVERNMGVPVSLEEARELCIARQLEDEKPW